MRSLGGKQPFCDDMNTILHMNDFGHALPQQLLRPSSSLRHYPVGRQRKQCRPIGCGLQRLWVFTICGNSFLGTGGQDKGGTLATA